eukprot:TRINITY_DN19235_c0_g1_i1.p1 TRINITY_DN19235_c0_g1~~TRINITY_DN19235_c0_g1_i1.p1  ORF type:complete len:321 (+),score=21.13 TRINITY_DN19235_c0_g1_i1:44-964(+)
MPNRQNVVYIQTENAAVVEKPVSLKNRIEVGPPAPRPPNLRVYPGTIQQASIKKTLLKDCDEIFKHKKSYWWAAGSPKRCQFEEFAASVLERYAAGYITENSGVEWWVQVRGNSTEEGLGFHWDRDEELAVEQRKIKCPYVGTVTYITGIGAPTVVADVAPLSSGSQKVTNLYVSHPELGKQIAFKGDLLHGCPPELMKPSKVPYKRYTILANVWLDGCPLKIKRAPDSLTNTLTHRDRLFSESYPGQVQTITSGSSSKITGFAFGREKYEEHEAWIPIPPKKSSFKAGTFVMRCPDQCKIIRRSP